MWKPFCEKGEESTCFFFQTKARLLLFSRGKMEVSPDKELDCTNKHFWADAMVFHQPDGSVWLRTSNRAPEEGGA